MTQPVRDRIDYIVAALENLGPNATHECVIVTPPSQKATAQIFKGDLEKLFREVRILELPQEFPEQHPKMGNVLRGKCFSSAYKQLASPFVWMENACPLVPGWLSILQEEYQIKKSAFLGHVVPALSTKDGETIELDDKFISTGVYTPRYGSSTTTVKGLTNQEHFEIKLIPIQQRSMADTSLIRNTYATNFKKKSGGKGDSWVRIKGEGVRDDRVSCDIDVPSMVLAGGEMDGSLEKIVADFNYKDFKNSVIEQRIVSETEEITRIRSQLKESEKRNDRLMDKIVELEKKVSAGGGLTEEDVESRIKEATKELLVENDNLKEDLKILREQAAEAVMK